MVNKKFVCVVSLLLLPVMGNAGALFDKITERAENAAGAIGDATHSAVDKEQLSHRFNEGKAVFILTKKGWKNRCETDRIALLAGRRAELICDSCQATSSGLKFNTVTNFRLVKIWRRLAPLV